MQILKNKKKALTDIQKQSLLAIAFVVLVSLGAQLNIDTGSEVKFTLQTLFISLLYFFMERKWRFVAVLLYCLLGIAGLPLFSAGNHGWEYFIAGSFGFFLGFITTAYIQPFGFNFQNIFNYFILVHLIIIALGVGVLAIQFKSFDPIAEIGLSLIPGAVIKSLAGAGICYLVLSKLKLR